MAVALPSLLDAPSLALTVVIPAYNETARLPAMLTAAVAYLSSSFPSLASSKPSLPNDTTNHTSKSAPDFEIVIVDDGSADGTAEKALELAGEHPGVEIRVVKLEQNLGKGGAVRHGMLHGRGKRLLMVDADGASRFEDLGLLWTALDTLAPQGEAGVAIGSRAHLVKTAAVVKRSFIRNFLMYGLHTVLRLVGVGHIRDTQCGFKLFTRAAAAQIFPRQHLTTWIFDVEVLLLAKQLGVPVVEVPIEWHEVPGSKLSVMRDSLQMLRDLLVLRANQLLGRWKLDLPENKPKSE
ncbi:glycosyltransferase family 2 protein [Auriscalpium vulgare]|uniref:Glycosyltransferase family 2 protein n=1 Tax=Auriscalpium vulgare TaxID=40419 RepID=A0ACB8R6E3_9AGAM|nr:glycosyltransferase family 2 protein [Auriscalpium vulgare]